MQDNRSLWLEAPNSVPLQCRSSPQQLLAGLPPVDTLGISFEDPDNPEPVLVASSHDRWVASWFPAFFKWLKVHSKNLQLLFPSAMQESIFFTLACARNCSTEVYTACLCMLRLHRKVFWRRIDLMV
jgi:hypothetical protein